MKALVYNFNIPKYLLSMIAGKIFPHHYFPSISCLSYTKAPHPVLPDKEWVEIKTLMSGICGSDMNAIMGRESFSMEAYSSFPATFGHENIGIITRVGEEVRDFRIGDRVYVEPVLSCDTRNLDPCPNCLRGHYALCTNFAHSTGPLAPGCLIGYNRSTGGGWGEYFVAHKNHVFRIPEGVGDRQAVMVDSLASALQPVLDHFPATDETVLIYGCGIVGINTIICLRALNFKGRILAIFKHEFQGNLALEKGADVVIKTNVFEKISELTNARLIKNTIGKPTIEGGVDRVFECIGNPATIDNSLRLLRTRGKLVLIATTGVTRGIDFSPIWFRELQICGSAMYSRVTFEGKSRRTYELTMELIKKGSLNITGLITHTFHIEEYKKAITTMLRKKENRNVKTIFSY